jgi:hypothetical protein
MTTAYDVISVQDVSHGKAQRRSANVVIDPGDMPQAREVLLKVAEATRMPWTKCTDDKGHKAATWRYADIVFVFLWTDRASVGVTEADARAMFAHNDVDRALIPVIGATEAVQVKGGMVSLVLP